MSKKAVSIVREAKATPQEKTYRLMVGVNLTVIKSEDLSEAEQMAAIAAFGGSSVHVTIKGENGRVLVDQDLPAKEFNSKKVGYGLSTKLDS